MWLFAAYHQQVLNPHSHFGVCGGHKVSNSYSVSDTVKGSRA
jgi:hypothetical protein